jgi:hypothetical protein
MKQNIERQARHSSNTIVSRSQFKPILFSTAMVEAIIAGRKTQTRRLIKTDAYSVVVNGYGGFCDEHGNPVKPKWQIGDILWVRETWQVTDFLHREDENWGYIYKASENGRDWESNDDNWKWKPSIFMPKEACRLFLEVTDLRAERLKQITEEDAEAEGVRIMDGEPVYPKDWKLCPACGGEGVHGACGESLGYIEVDCSTCDTYKKRYQHLWNSINGNWDENPLVWVITFKVVECPQGFC